MKKTFTYRTEWSDQSEHSPQTVGQLPDKVRLPDGVTVDLQSDGRFQRPSRAGYVQIHENVRVRYKHWGDNGTQRMGRAGSKVEILAPKGSTFLFQSRCPLCGEARMLVSEAELTPHGRAPQRWHEDCWREVEYREELDTAQRHQ